MAGKYSARKSKKKIKRGYEKQFSEMYGAPYKYPKGAFHSMGSTGRGKPTSAAQRRAQKKQNASKRAKQKRVATALKKFLHAQNPAVKYDGAAIVKLKGGAVRITPIKAKRGRR
jgi:hypothetical protein